jgi:solute carrier family 35 protein F5
VYAVCMKKRIGNEGRVNMPIFFGMVGLMNLVMMWPGFFLLHFTGIERFALPPDNRVLTIIIVSSGRATSLDCARLLTNVCSVQLM